jgi:hypothetical protein
MMVQAYYIHHRFKLAAWLEPPRRTPIRTPEIGDVLATVT